MLLQFVLMSVPAIVLAIAFALNSRQRIEAHNHTVRQRGEQITP
jgi:hypothetical protein